jgi:hypothetical protein
MDHETKRRIPLAEEPQSGQTTLWPLVPIPCSLCAAHGTADNVRKEYKMSPCSLPLLDYLDLSTHLPTFLHNQPLAQTLFNLPLQ